MCKTQNTFAFQKIPKGEPDASPKTNPYEKAHSFTFFLSPVPRLTNIFQIDMFSFGVLLAQLLTSEYPRLDTRKAQVHMFMFAENVGESADRANPSCR